MTVADLKEMLNELPDDMDVLIPMNAGEGFTGAWFTPCIEESGGVELGIEDLTDEEIKERKLLNKPIEVDNALCLVPCGFFEPHEGVAPELN